MMNLTQETAPAKDFAGRECPDCGASMIADETQTRQGARDPIHSIRWACGRRKDTEGSIPCPNKAEDAPDPIPESVVIETAPAVEVKATSSAPAETGLPAVLKALADEIGDKKLLTIMSGAKITEARLLEIEKLGKMVVPNLRDKKALAEVTRLRIGIKNDRVMGTKICDSEREPHLRKNQLWLQVKNYLDSRTKPSEAHLQKIEDAAEALQAADAREAEKARAAKLQARVDACTTAGVAPDVVAASALSDDDWNTWLSERTEIVQRARDVRILSEELTSLGDPCMLGEAREMSTEEAKVRLDKAREAAHHRAEDARIAAEKAQRIADEKRETERKERELLELGQRRLAEMIRLGAEEGVTMEQLSILTVESWERIESVATEAWNNRQRIAQEDWTELERLRKIEADRLAKEKANQEASDAQKAKDDADAARAERERLDADHQERLRPDREAIRAWLIEYGRALPAWPEMQDRALWLVVERAREDIGSVLRALAQIAGGEA